MAFRKKRKDPFKEIQSCLHKRDYKGALDWFNTLLQKDSKNTQIRLRFADTLVLAGSKKEAVKQLRIVADELADKGFMIRAIAINKKILQIDPGQSDVHEKLAAMKEERSTSTSRAALADVLSRPDAPLRRASEEQPAPTQPPPPAPPPEPKPDVAETLPEMSLEESMALEFGDAGEIPMPATETLAPEPPAPEPPVTSGGFELMEDAQPDAPAGPSDALGDEPTFEEEPFELDVGSSTEPAAEEAEIVSAEAVADEPVIELSFDGIDEAPSSPEIVLDVSEPPSAEEPEAEMVPELIAEVEVETEEPEILVVGEEMEVVEFEMESEPELAPDASEALIGALGEDIDSLIDSIIDDVGTSAKGEQPTEDEPPTHIPLFSDLTTPEFIDVAILLVRRVAKIGEQIVQEGAPGDSMFIISTGEVRATVERDGQQLAVATLRDGDFFGEMAVLSGEPRTATVTSVKNTELLELSRENLREICSRHPHVEAKIRLAYDERIASDRGR